MKDKAVEIIFARAIDDSLHQERCDASPAPLRFGEYVNNDSLPSISDSNLARLRDRPRRDVVKLDAGAADNNVRRFLETGQTADVLATTQHLFDSRACLRAKWFKQAGRDFSHVLEHPSTTPGNCAGIGGRGQANGE